jgi:hypothetical protein
MKRYAHLAAAFFALAMTGASWLPSYPASGYQPYGQLYCEGRFGRFAYGQLASEPSQLTFVIDWQGPAIVTDTGIAGRITSWTPLQLSFDIQYPTYRASYFISRIDGTISQTGDFNGVFRGTCDLGPLDTRF